MLADFARTPKANPGRISKKTMRFEKTCTPKIGGGHFLANSG